MLRWIVKVMMISGILKWITSPVVTMGTFPSNSLSGSSLMWELCATPILSVTLHKLWWLPARDTHTPVFNVQDSGQVYEYNQ